MSEQASTDFLRLWGHTPALRDRALLITSMYKNDTLMKNFGEEAYSYRVVYNAFADLLRRCGQIVELEGCAEKDVAATAARIRQQGQSAIHLSFLPLHMMPLAGAVPDVSVLAWEYPDIPNEDLGGDSRQNWLKMAEKVALIITHTNFSRAAFLRSGVRVPVHVVPVPIRSEYFAIPRWQPGQRVEIDCPCYVFQQNEIPPRRAQPKRNLKDVARLAARRVYRSAVKRYLPPAVLCRVTGAYRALQAAKVTYNQHVGKYAATPQVFPKMELSGVVYTSLLNTYDSRKNWEDLLSGYLLALGDRHDATLVIKLIVSPERSRYALHEVFARYRRLGLRHNCKLVVTTAYLSNQQMLDLARATTFYVNTSRAEGSCLPLQDYMAAGRPAIAPAHTGMADSMVSGVGFPIETCSEPGCWPQDPEWYIRTTSQRLNWDSLVQHLRGSYDLAHQGFSAYECMADRAKKHMRKLCSVESVWPLLATALDSIASQELVKKTLVPKSSPIYLRAA